MSNDALPEPLHAVAVVGSVTIDRNSFAGRTLHKIGGVATYAGMTYRRHAVPTRVVCNVAEAEAPILSLLIRDGVQVHNGRTAHTTRFVNHVQPDGRAQATPSLAASIDRHQITAALKGVNCVHLGPLHPADIDPPAFDGLADSRALVVLDVQGLVRRIDHGRIVPAASEHLAAALRAADIVKADEAELQVILAAYGEDIAALMNRFHIAEWVVTNGPKSGCIHVRGGRRHLYEPAPIAALVDPTGAGDVFLAAYTVARFKQRQPVAAAGNHAAQVAAEYVSGRYINEAALDISRLRIDNNVNDV
jgi:sugar/nucleoside kinase (ribokinase family)